MLPPRFIRRLAMPPLVFLLTLTAVATLPLWLVLAALASLRRPAPQRRATRLIWFAVVWLILESAALAACLALWIASGFGGRLHTANHQDRHYTLIRWFLARLYTEAVRAFQLTVEIDEPPPTPEEMSRRLTRPVIVLSRHAGPGDSFLLVYHLLRLYRRRPRIVMKATLQYDPGLDVVVNRLPHAFVPKRTNMTLVIAEIQRLAATMGPLDALVIFPEGGNFTPERRTRTIERLQERELVTEAERARRMAHLLAPRPGGAIAAIDACPEADVVFVAHTGLDELVSMRDVWRRLPVAATIKAKWWRVLADDVPREREAQLRWLYDQWEEIDAWIAAHKKPRSTR